MPHARIRHQHHVPLCWMCRRRSSSLLVLFVILIPTRVKESVWVGVSATNHRKSLVNLISCTCSLEAMLHLCSAWFQRRSSSGALSPSHVSWVLEMFRTSSMQSSLLGYNSLVMPPPPPPPLLLMFSSSSSVATSGPVLLIIILTWNLIECPQTSRSSSCTPT